VFYGKKQKINVFNAPKRYSEHFFVSAGKLKVATQIFGYVTSNQTIAREL
jgi:hypothetical protein